MKWRIIAAGVAALFLSVVVPIAQASADPSQSSTDPSAGLIGSTQKGAVSLTYLKAHRSEFRWLRVPPPMARALGEVVPADANGCNQDVCIQLVGTNDSLTLWQTTAYTSSGEGCYDAGFHRPAGDNIGDLLCVPPELSGQAWAFWDSTGPTGTNMPVGSYCNSWSRIPDAPCETVY